jgi:hypothetical protein
MARFLVAAVVLVLAWRVIEVNATLVDEDGRPRPPQAHHGLYQGGDEASAAAALVRGDPAESAGYLVIARELRARGEGDAATRAYAAAYEVAPVDRDVLISAASDALQAGRTAAALDLLARALDNDPSVQDRAYPVMRQSLASGRYGPAWAAIAARNPEWLGGFVADGCRRGVDPLALVPLFLQRVARSAATPAETACLVDRLRDTGRWDEAYQVWLDTLPANRLADVGFIFNGGFEYASSALGFDWIADARPERESGHAVEFSRTRGAAGERALRVEFNGKRQSGIPISQYMALAPGRYELTGVARPDGVHAGHGAQWTVRCAGEGNGASAPLAASGRFVGSSDWQPFAFDVTVPPGCRGQLLQLETVAPASGPVYLAGTLWFDNLSLRQYH